MTRIDPTLPFLKPILSTATATAAAKPVATVTLADSPASLARLTAGSIIAGLVLSRDARGLTQVRTAHGVLSFRTPLSLPPGTQLILQLQTAGSQIQVGILSVTPPADEGDAPPPAAVTRQPAAAATGTTGTTAATLPHAALSLAGEWSSLTEALAVLRNAGSPAAQTIESLIARSNPQIASTLLSFVAVLARGDFRALLSRELGRALTAVGRGDLATRLSEDLAQLGRLAAGSDDGEWRTFLIPFAEGERVEQIHFFLKRKRSSSDEGEDGHPVTRFVFEVNPSRLGRLQLDGLAGGTRFDLMVRSQSPLPDPVKSEIAGIFASARVASKLTGSIAFQVVPEFTVAPLETALAPDDGVVV